MSAVRPWVVTTSDERVRKFRTFDAAEQWARKVVSESAEARFPISAAIDKFVGGIGVGNGATVRMDALSRVWTDLATHTWFTA